MGRKVVWSGPAIRQRREIFRYWDIHNKSTTFSKKLRKEFHAAMRDVATMPSIGSFTEDADVLKRIVRAFIIYYRFDESMIYVDAIWDTRRNPDDAPYSY